MAILFTDRTYHRERLFGLVQKHMPGTELRLWPDVGNPDDIDYVIAFQPEPGSLHKLPRLKAIFLTSAGVDAALSDPDLNSPALSHVPIMRCINENLSAGMAEYVVYHALKYHRKFHLYDQQQRDHLWQQHKGVLAPDRTIGVMGVGEMGMACLNALQPFHFQLRGWSRTAKDIDGVTHFAGMDALPEFLSGCDIVVCVLPLTDETRGILCAENLQHLPQGSYLINAGRGGHMIEADIVSLLESGQLAGATLDVFPTEPLPADQLLWSHPNVTITPHIASLTDFKTLCANIDAQIAAFEKGDALRNVVDVQRGY